MPIAQDLLERVLNRLGFSERPEPTLENLALIYASWCRRVPFDNVRKMIHVQAENPAPLPGDTAEDFFEAWLKHGTGATCWAGAGANHALLETLGFDARRSIGTMMVVPDLPPNHGTVLVRFGEDGYVVDSSMLHAQPLRLEDNAPTRIAHGAWGVSSTWREQRAHVWWRTPLKPEGFECRFERFDATADDFRTAHERTRGWSPFNFETSARINRGEKVFSLGLGHSVTFHADGSLTRVPVTMEERNRQLIETFGLSEEIVAQLPPDRKTPPPPGTLVTAAAS